MFPARYVMQPARGGNKEQINKELASFRQIRILSKANQTKFLVQSTVYSKCYPNFLFLVSSVSLQLSGGSKSCIPQAFLISVSEKLQRIPSN